MSLTPETPILAKPDVMLRVPMGLTSPLWGYFAGAAVSGAAFWWMTRWANPQNLEAMFARAAPVEAAPEPVEIVESPAEVAVEAETVVVAAQEAVIDAATAPVAEPVLEVIAEATSEPIAETDAPVEGAAASVPAPRPRTKKTASTAD